MKKPNPIAESFAEMEQRIRLDERNRMRAEVLSIESTLNDCCKRLIALMPDEDEDGVPPMLRTVPAPKRKAVTATAEHIEKAWQTLCNTSPRYAFLSPDNVAAVWGILDNGKRRMAGAALKALVADGRATVKRGKYAQVEPKVEDNADHIDSSAS